MTYPEVDELKFLGSQIQGNGDCERGVKTGTGWMEFVAKNNSNTMRQEGTSKDRGRL